MKHFLIFILCFAFHPIVSADNWEAVKKTTLQAMEGVPGWCSHEKAIFMMDLIKKNKCKTCIEIGVFAGKSLFPIVRALVHNKKGVVYAIDPWESFYALQGVLPNSTHYSYWASIDFNKMLNKTRVLCNQSKIERHCKIIKKTAEEALSQFEDNSIDFIHMDGSREENLILEHTKGYFQKLKNGGYFLLTEPNGYSMRLALVFLLERATIASPFTREAEFVLFRKNKERIKNADSL